MTRESIRVFKWEFSIVNFSTIVFSSLIVISELFNWRFSKSTSAVSLLLRIEFVGVGGLAVTIVEFELIEQMLAVLIEIDLEIEYFLFHFFSSICFDAILFY